jgi:hypothetical protein
MLDLEVLPGVVLRDYAGKVVHSSVVAEGHHDLLATAKPTAPAHVVVVGGAHSAWSVAWALTQQAVATGGAAPLVRILHRSPVRLFYMSAAEALADGYDFDAVADVCPLSGRVHRFSGLRGDARDLARRAFGFASGKELPAEVSCLAVVEERREEIISALEDADVVVSAVGYDARLPELLGVDGEPLRVSGRDVGLPVSPAGELLDTEGRPIPELLACGLGAGFDPSTTVGGEPSASTQADGVWLYHHDVGNVLLDRMLQGERERLASVC